LGAVRTANSIDFLIQNGIVLFLIILGICLALLFSMRCMMRVTLIGIRKLENAIVKFYVTVGGV
jgi:hydrogenase/urease accessory protein HupE